MHRETAGNPPAAITHLHEDVAERASWQEPTLPAPVITARPSMAERSRPLRERMVMTPLHGLCRSAITLIRLCPDLPCRVAMRRLFPRCARPSRELYKNFRKDGPRQATGRMAPLFPVRAEQAASILPPCPPPESKVGRGRITFYILHTYDLHLLPAQIHCAQKSTRTAIMCQKRSPMPTDPLALHENKGVASTYDQPPDEPS